MTEEKIFTTEDLKAGVGDDLFATAKDATIDSCSNFLAGKTTSAFNKMVTSDVGQNLTSITVTGVGGYGAFKAVADPEFIKEFTTKLVTTAIEKVTEKVIAYTTAKTSAIVIKTVTSPLAIAKGSTTYLLEHKTTLSKELKRQLIAQDTQSKKDTKETENNEITYFIKKIKTKLSYLNKKATDITGCIATYSALVTSYIENGPQWVSDKVNLYLDLGITKATYFIGEKTYDISYSLDAWINTKTEEIGQGMVEEYNAMIAELAKEIADSNKVLLDKGKIKANGAKQSAILKVAAMVGI